MEREAISRRGLATHIVLNVEPLPDRPLMLKFEMNDDGCQAPGSTLGKAIRSAYPSGVIEVLLLDLIEDIAQSDAYCEAADFLQEGDEPGIDKIRKSLARIASYWQEHRPRFIAANAARRNTTGEE